MLLTAYCVYSCVYLTDIFFPEYYSVLHTVHTPLNRELSPIMPITTAATTLRQSLQKPDCFISAPGVYDGVSARIALSVGFDALYMVSPPPLPLPRL